MSLADGQAWEREFGWLSPPPAAKKTLTFSGASDDTFGCAEADYDNCASGKPIVFRVASGADSVLVWGQYAPVDTPAAGWVVGIVNDNSPNPHADEKPIPGWPMRLQAGDTPYSPTLVLEVPADATVTLVHPKREH